MPHLALGVVIMVAGALVMAYGLYIRSLHAASTRGRAVAMVETVGLILLGLIIAIAGIIVSLEPNATAPR